MTDATAGGGEPPGDDPSGGPTGSPRPYNTRDHGARFSLRCERAWLAWARRGARFAGFTLAGLVTQAVWFYLRERGFAEQAPSRYVDRLPFDQISGSYGPPEGADHA